MVAQPKKVDTGKLQHHRREFQVEIQNRFAAHTSIPPDSLDSWGDATTKMIHEAVISIANRYKSEKPGKLSTGTKQLREKRRQNEEEWHTNGQRWKIRDYARRFDERWRKTSRKHDEKQIIEAIENSKSLKQAR